MIFSPEKVSDADSFGAPFIVSVRDGFVGDVVDKVSVWPRRTVVPACILSIALRTIMRGKNEAF